VLHFCGAIRYEPTTPTEPSRTQYDKIVFDWQQLLAVVQDPVAALKKTYKWGDQNAPFEYQRFFEALANVLRAIGLATNWFAPGLRAAVDLPLGPGHQVHSDVDGLATTFLYGLVPQDQICYEIGMELFPAAQSGQPVPSGLMLRPVVSGGAEGQLPLSDNISLQWKAGATSGDLVQFYVFPDKEGVTFGQPTVDASLQIAGTRTDPWYLVGTAKSARIELYSPSLRLAVGGSVGDPEATLHLGTAAAAGQPGCKLVVPLDDADSFVKEAAAQNAIQVGFTPEIIWSSRSGFSFNGSPTPSITLPASVSLGPITIENVRIRFSKKPDGTTSNATITFRAGVDVSGDIGPIKFVIQDVGFACDIIPYTHQEVLALPPGVDKPVIGNLGISFGFAAPTGAGLAVDAVAVTGGGFLTHDEDKHEYAGALDLTLSDIAIKGYGLVQTQLPGGVSGYSFIVALSAEFSPSIQLPFGFSLDGVGGIIGVHRTISIAAVQTALWAHHLDGLLFPKDPIASAPQLIAALDTYFPGAPGRYIVGPMAKIGWGDGIVEGEIALLIEVPEPLKLLLLGEIVVGVPMEKPQLELHISFDGGLDFGKKLAFFDATLHDSRIESFPIIGDLAFRDGWGDDGSFALALGGFNPHFQPPAAFPILKRLAITIGSSVAQIEAQAYIALTANTLQFGARAEVTAGTGSFNVHGWLGLDALCERHPMSFTFDLSGGIDLRHGTDVLASVHLDGHLSGPTPWHISGDASLSLFLFDVTVHFDKTWGSSGDALSLPDPLSLLLAALADLSSYRSVLPPGVRAITSLAGAATDANQALLLEPAGTLRIAQRVLPFGQPLTRFGGAPLGRTLQFTMDGVTAFTTTFQQPPTTTEEFAPAQYFEFSDAEKLSLPSFNKFDAGVEIAGDATDIGSGSPKHAVVTQLTYDTTIFDSVSQKPGKTYVLGAGALQAMNGRVMAQPAGLSRYAPPAGTPSRVTLAPDRWVIAGANDLVLRSEITSDGSKLGAQLALNRFLAANADQRGQLQVVLLEEAA
jgi:hypothetical protein